MSFTNYFLYKINLFSRNRYLNEQELEPSETVEMLHMSDGRVTLILKDTMPETHSGTVKGVAKNLGGEAPSSANHEIRGRAPTFIEKPLKCTVLEGDTCIFRCKIDGDPYPTIEWTKGKWTKILDNTNNRVYKDEENDQHVCEILNVTKKQGGSYQITITNEHGTETCPASLTVTEDASEAEDWKASLKRT